MYGIKDVDGRAKPGHDGAVLTGAMRFAYCALRAAAAMSARLSFRSRKGRPPCRNSAFPLGVGMGLIPRGVAAMGPITTVSAEQLTRALGEAVVRTWSNLPKDVQNCLFQAAVTFQGESIRPQLAIFLHDKHPRTSDPLGKPREMMEPDSLGG
jgi:hypothetical protein